VNTDSLAVATHGYINSASCEWIATLVTVAHHSIWRHLYDSMHGTQKPESKLKFVMFDQETNMNTLWAREEFLRTCSEKDLAEKALKIEMTIPVKTSQETRYTHNVLFFS